MSRQEEIREVIDLYTDDCCLFPDRSCNALGSGYCSSGPEAYRCLMERLGNIGVVLKVERELPDNKLWHQVNRQFEAYCAGKNDMIGAGFVAVESLIEESNDAD